MLAIDEKNMSNESMFCSLIYWRCSRSLLTQDIASARVDSTSSKIARHDPERLSVSVGQFHELGINTQPVRRHFSVLNIVALSFNISNSWVAIASSLAIAISAGGTATLIYGIPLATLAYAATAASLAELASCYPTAGGQ
jgi:choline transport protein